MLGARDFLVVRGSPDERIAAIARRQRGRVARRQLRAAGVSEWAVRRRVDSGRLIRRRAGVYAVGHLAPMELAAETEAVLACRPGALLSHHSAVALWAMRPRQSEIVHALVVGSEGPRQAGIRCHRTRHLDPKDIRIHNALPVTSPARTLLDIAPDLTTHELEWALDEALTSRVMTRAQVAELLRRCPRRPGASTLAKLLAHRSGPAPTRSLLEKRFLQLIRAANLPHPRTNVRLHGYEVDAHWPSHGVVFEIDSHRYHSSRSAFTRDRRKEATLKQAGLDFNRVSDYQLEHEQFAVVAFVAQRLARTQRAAAA